MRFRVQILSWTDLQIGSWLLRVLSSSLHELDMAVQKAVGTLKVDAFGPSASRLGGRRKRDGMQVDMRTI